MAGKMETRKRSLLHCLVFMIIIQATQVYCFTFENLSSKGIDPRLRKHTIAGLRRALNGSKGVIEFALVVRYPNFLGIAATIFNSTENATYFNPDKQCRNIKKLLLATTDSCGFYTEKFTPCFLPKEFFNNISDLCPPKKRNYTDAKEPVQRQIVTEYFLLAVKLLTGTAKTNYERSCNKRGGQLNYRTDKCMISSPIENTTSEIYAIATSAPFDNSLFIISFTGNVISLACLILLLITYITLGKYKTVPGKSTMCLSLALIGTHSSQILVSYLHSNKTACITLAVLLHWFFLCNFLWMSALSYEYFTTFHKLNLMSSNPKVIRLRVYCLISVSLPTIAVIICLALDIPNKSITHYGTNDRCFITGFYTNLCAFVIPIALLISMNISLLFFTIHDLRMLRNSTRHVAASNRKETLLLLMATKLAVLVGAAWIMAFIDGFVSNTIVKYIYTIIVTYQGFILYMAFGCFTQMVKAISGKIANAKKTSEKAPTKESRL